MISVMSEVLLDIPNTAIHARLGTFLFHQGDPVRHMFWVVSGEVQLIRRQDQGQSIILQRGTPGTILAEAFLFADCYHCDAVVLQDSSIRRYSREAVLRKFETDASFARQWAAHLSQEIRTARFKAELLSHRKIVDRLDLWIAHHGQLPEKGAWKRVAAEIGASPEAFYRVMAKKSADR